MWEMRPQKIDAETWTFFFTATPKTFPHPHFTPLCESGLRLDNACWFLCLVKVQYIGNTKVKKREPKCGKIEASTNIQHRRVLDGKDITGSIFASTGFEIC